MSSGKNLQEMEVGTKQVRDAINSKAVFRNVNAVF